MAWNESGDASKGTVPSDASPGSLRCGSDGAHGQSWPNRVVDSGYSW